MKKILFALILSVGFFATSARADDGLRVGVMDVMKINSDAAVMKSLNKQKDSALADIQKIVNAKRKDFEKREDELKTKQSLMDKEAFLKELQSFQKDVMDYDKQTEQKVAGIEKAYIEALKTIQKDYLDRIVRKIGAEKKYSLVLNSQTTIVLDKNLDITDSVIDALNEEVKEIKLNVK